MTDKTAPLDQLIAGNMRYVQGNTTAQNNPERRVELAADHIPLAAILCCSDARVAPEIVFDQPLGTLFTCRVAGNIPTTEMLESLEYAIVYLGVSLVIVMGHSSCGAVKGALESENPVGLFSKIALPTDSNLDAAVIHNANHGVKTMFDQSAVLLESVESGDLTVVSGVQDIASGKFTVLDCYKK